jgi:hypothetical protein
MIKALQGGAVKPARSTDLIDRMTSNAKLTMNEVERLYLRPFDFFLLEEQTDDKLLKDPEHQIFNLASYSLRIWRSVQVGDVIWFLLDTDLAHVSTINACIAIPRDLKRRGNLFVMNLNLKTRFDAYNVILGYRGIVTGHYEKTLKTVLAKELAMSGYNPRFIQKNPHGFAGLRAQFPLTESVIDKSYECFLMTIPRWFQAMPRVHNKNRRLAFLSSYKGFMNKIHNREGRVFDAIFGEKWLSNLFHKMILTRL